MNVEIVQGKFNEAMEYSESKTKENIFFELSYIESDENAIFEFNRFLQELNISNVIGENKPKRVIINLSAWNESYQYNKYLESFLYMLSDKQEDLEYKLICEKEVNKELFKKISNLKIFSFSLTPLPSMIKKKETTKIGFYDNGNGTGVERNV